MKDNLEETETRVKPKSLARTFSRVFPSYHPKAGRPTYFVEQIFNWYWETYSIPGAACFEDVVRSLNPHLPIELIDRFIESIDGDMVDVWKSHTIRAGYHFKAGDMLVPKVWSGRPYASKQIQFAPPIKITKTWDFDIYAGQFFIDQRPISEWKGNYLSDVATKDGLDTDDFKDWFKFPKPFEGQIICWNESIEY